MMVEQGMNPLQSITSTALIDIIVTVLMTMRVISTIARNIERVVSDVSWHGSKESMTHIRLRMVSGR
jgi:hypothetical protein